MDERKSLGTVIASLENLFQKFNEKFYAGKLQAPVITVSPDTTGGAYGWCTAWKAWKDSPEATSDEGYYEINLCAEHLTRPFEQICGTLLHEMVHLYNLYEGVQDTSRGGTYHNKRFKEAAEQRGLHIEKSEKYGWTITTLNEEGKAFVESLNHEGFDFFRTPIPPAMKRSGGGSSSRKYVCPRCGCIIRATKEVRVICADCDVEFELEE